MSEFKLKPCPICGGEVDLYEYELDAFRTVYAFECRDCLMQTQYPYSDKVEAIKTWNTRKPLERICEQLENNSFRTESTFDEDGYCNYDSEEVILLDKAIEIVKEEGE